MTGNHEKAIFIFFKKQRVKRIAALSPSIYYRTYNKMRTYHVLSVVAVLAIPKT